MYRNKLRIDVDDLNALFATAEAFFALRQIITDGALGRLVLVSSFGAESAVLLHMIAQIDRNFPIVFLNTEMLFAQTLEYQRDLAREFGLRDVRVIRPNAANIAQTDPDGLLHQRAPNACCMLRKGQPLIDALADFDGWISGRKRYQGGARSTLKFAERDPNNDKIKLNPLWNWTTEELRQYMDNHDLPRHPLAEKGFASIGCAPCTTPINDDEDPRAGRWRGQEKSECGIHLPAPKGEAANYLTSFDGTFIVPKESTIIDPNEEFTIDAVHNTPHVTILFDDFADGRGFSIARALRRAGYTGRLRAKGVLIPDQFIMAQRVGFDELEIEGETAKRHDAANWQNHAPRNTDYQSRLGQARR